MAGRWPRMLYVVAAWIVLVGTAGGQAGSRRAPPPPPPQPKGPVAYLKSLLPWTSVEEPADFVRASRPTAETDFMPLGEASPESGLKVKTDAELAAAKAALDGVSANHNDLAAHPPALTPATPPPPPALAAAAKPAPVKKAAKRREKHKSTASADPAK